MSPELDFKLTNAFPRLYSQRNGTPTQTAMCWGFECGDGWFDLIWDLSLKIETENRKLHKDFWIVATQVKEKFGTLRFYTNFDVPDVEDAENKSAVTCETCGKPGNLNTDGYWYKTHCVEHK